MYPTNADGSPNNCYDSNRPSWLPYYIDDVTESNCFYPEPTLAGQMGGAIGQGASLVTDAAGNIASGFLENYLGEGNPSNTSNFLTLVGLGIVGYLVLRRLI